MPSICSLIGYEYFNQNKFLYFNMLMKIKKKKMWIDTTNGVSKVVADQDN